VRFLMDVTKLSNDGLMFFYFSNKKQMDLLYKQQKDIESEIASRIDNMRIKAQKGELIIKESDDIESIPKAD